MEKIRVTITKKGTSTIEVDGVKGESCKDLTKKLEEAMGSVTSDTETMEYHEQEATDTLIQY